MRILRLGKVHVLTSYLRRAVRPVGAVAAATGVLFLSGCSGDTLKTGYLPTTRDTTDKVNQVIDLWNYSWIAGMAVGVLVWGLLIYAMIAFRRKDDKAPAQSQYNVPLELTCTIVPVFMVLVLFAYTAPAQADLEKRLDNPDVKITAYGKQWAWDFVYTDAEVYDSTMQVAVNAGQDADKKAPVLYLPVNKNVEITLKARDVIHSFWVPAFLYKKDMVPGRTNYWTFKPQKEGVYQGKCAELCGEYHSGMLFKVAVVSQAEYDAHLEKLKAKGNVGLLGDEFNQWGNHSKKPNGGNK